MIRSNQLSYKSTIGENMNCPWKNNKCMSNCLMKFCCLALSILGVAILIKIISLILYIFSCGIILNTVIAIVATVIVLGMYCCKGCGKSTSTCENKGCDLPTENEDKAKE
jgi:hypothetical protein